MRLGRDFRHLEALAESLGLPLAAVQRYAKGASAAGWMQRLWNLLNGTGRTADRLKISEVPAAVQQAIGAALEAPPRPGRPVAPPPRQPGGGRRPPTAPPNDSDGGGLPPGGFSRSRFNPNHPPPLPGESNPHSEEIVCDSESSNVYSFSYDGKASTLFVTYKAHSINQENTRTDRVKRGKRFGRPQLVGEKGGTVGKGRGGRGAMYAYFDVPARVFERMKNAASKGKFVWDELRIRGTVFGHKFRYQLVQGQVTPGTGVYIPRKATAKGFRTRSVADLGNGRRGFQTSTLPQQNGFSTRRRK